ncbi:autotransporter-associated beta strand repeat-containing protein [Luteolibacter sp. LG18]|uniref:autotransporter-associated beta strand repeat-containing protein n=1 Tax=Luteolibacter sp. LG18 TaxID=2819286 RepID=UPI002B314901|nr:hypothetical protein llg_41660 [Luteolibacter sp. LG18]
MKPILHLALLVPALLFGGLQRPATAQAFVHPGLLSTQADLNRIKAKVAAGEQPWKAGYDKLAANGYSSANYTAYPHPIICRGGNCASMGLSQDYITMARDASAAYQCALRYHITGDTAYADAAIRNMDGYSSTVQQITGSTDALLLAAQAFQWACAAELMRGYQPWVDSGGLVNFQVFLLTKFYQDPNTGNGIGPFLEHHNGTCDTHYWANWDLLAMNAVLAIGVVCDDRTIYNKAVNYYKSGIGNGAADKVMWFRHPGNLGQAQESGRDQGHNSMGPVLLGSFCEMAWSQGDDLYGYNDNTLLAISEYVARYNLGNDVPYVTAINCDSLSNRVGMPAISDASRGIYRPGYELIYNHYANRRGIAAPYTMRMALTGRPEGGGGDYGQTSGGFDQIGFTTLTHSLDPIAPASVPAPRGVTADPRNNTVVLSWWGSANAATYKVKRATTAGGPYTVVASGLPGDKFTYHDAGLGQNTTYLYAISAVLGNGVETPDSAPVTVTTNQRLKGTIIGTGDAYLYGMWREQAFDDANVTFFDSSTASGSWAGLDLGAPHVITQVNYQPRIGYAGRMTGGLFQGSNTPDFSSGVVTLSTIGGTPPAGMSSQNISNPGAFRYVRYLGPNNGYCNVAELQFHGYPNPAIVPAAPTGLAATAGNAKVTLAWTPPATATGFTVKRATVPGGPYVSLPGPVTGASFVDTTATNGATHYYVVSASNATGESANSAEIAVTPSAGAPTDRITWSGALTANWDTATLNWQTGGAQVAFAPGTAVLFDDSSGSATTINVAAPVTPSSVVFNNGWRSLRLDGNAINSPGPFTKTGGGPLFLSAANSFPSANLGGGEVTIQNAGSLGTGPITLGGGTLSTWGSLTLGNVIVISGSGGLQLASNANLTLTGALSGNGALTLGNDENPSSLYLSGTNTMTGGSVTVANNANAVRFTTAAAGNPNVDWVFNNTTAGRTALEFSSGTLSLGSLAGNGLIQGNRSGTNSMNVVLEVGANHHSTTFSGILRDNRLGTGPIGLTKTGNGTLTLTGASDYSGATTVSAGRLALATTFASNSSFQVANGAVLAVNNTSPGPAAVANLTLAGGSTLEIGNPTSTTVPLVTCGGVTVGGGCTVKIAQISGTLGLGTYPLISYSGSFQGSLANLQLQLPAGVSGTLANSNGKLSLAITSLPLPVAPAELTASIVNGQVAIGWSAVPYAATYNVWRSTTSGGGYTLVATVFGTGYIDTAASAAGTYYYAVTSSNDFGTSPQSSAATVTTLGAGRSAISIDFQGGGSSGTPAPMGAAETAGAVSLANWNASGGASGTVNSLKDYSGATTSANVAWTSNNTWSTNIPDTAGDRRMMKGYLDTNNTSTTTVTVSGLPSAFTGAGYDVYVYTDGDTGSTKAGDYTLGARTIKALDTGGSHFSGTYVQADGTAGNHIRFTGLTSSTFTLSATGDQTYSGPRAPVNGIQIVIPASAATTPAAPTALTAMSAPGLGIDLSWIAAAGATSYNLKRATVPGGPYVTLATNVTTTAYNDPTASTQTLYYYVVSAVNGAGEGTPSPETGIVPTAPPAAISIDFIGGGGNGNPAAMAAGEVAGAVAVANWNSATGAAGSLSGLVDNLGHSAAATVTWSSNNTWSTPITESTGGYRMMKGYLDTTNTSTTSVSLTGIPAAWLPAGYDVYVYCDGDTATTKGGKYTIGATTLDALDNAATHFSGTYVQAENSAGNHVKFSGLGTASFTLGARGDQSYPGPRAPVNGLQIVARPPSTPTGLAAAPDEPGGIALTWDASAGASAYQVMRAVSAGGPWFPVGLAPSPNFTDSGLPAAAGFYYTVISHGIGGAGPASAPVSATTFTPLESWRFGCFGTAANAGTAADQADPDGDGWNNAQEFAASTDPNNPASHLAISSLETGAQDAVILFTTVIGKTYRVEYSETLEVDSWTAVQDHIAGTGGTMAVSDTGGGNRPKRFYRVVVQ